MIKGFLIAIAGVAVGGVSGLMIHYHLESAVAQRCADEFPLVNPYSVCLGDPAIAKTPYFETRYDIEQFIEEAQGRGLESVSVYFRDLRHGPVFGINELQNFAPASLMKLPLALVFLSAAEREPEVLDARIRYAGTTTVSQQGVPPQESAREGEDYTISELLRLMLSYSDNASYEALEAFLNASDDRRTIRNHVFQELGFIDPLTRTVRSLTVRGYASLFTLVHNASFLNPQLSNLVLSWLAESQFDVGLVAGVPRDVTVAHKFGERTYEDGIYELHDCGIIYFPENPYLLCVMTRGDDHAKQAAVIAEISRRVYQEVASRQL